jgi:hypothetical protein
MMQQYYECPEQVNLVVPGGQSVTFAIPYPTRVRLTRLSVIQTAGTPGNFTVDLYNQAVPNSPSAGGVDEMWRVAPTQSESSAGVMAVRFADVDVYFQNTDPDVFLQVRSQNTPSLISTQAHRKIYARITNQGGGSCTYSLVLGSFFEG